VQETAPILTTLQIWDISHILGKYLDFPLSEHWK